MTGRIGGAAVGIVWSLGLALSCSSEGQNDAPGDAASAEAGSSDVAGSSGAPSGGQPPGGGAPAAGKGGGGTASVPFGGVGGDAEGGNVNGGESNGDVGGGGAGAPNSGGAGGVPSGPEAGSGGAEAGSGGESGNPCSSSADLVWAKPVAKLGLGASVFARSIAALPDSSSVVVGELSGGAGVRFGAGTPQEVVTNALGAFWARFDANGALMGARRFIGPYANGVGVAALSDGSFVFAGYFRDRLAFDSGLPTEQVLNTDDPQDEDPFLARIGANGNVVWAIRGAGVTSTNVTSVAVLPNDDIALVGTGAVTFGSGDSAVHAGFGTGLNDGYVAVFTSGGTPRWARAVRANSVNHLAALTDGSLALTGWFFQSATFASAPNGTDITFNDGNRYWESLFVARYLASGELSWVKRTTNRALGTGVLSGASDRILVTGYADGGVFNPGEPTPITLTDARFIAEYDTAGQLRGVQRTNHRYTENDVLLTSQGALVSAGAGTAFGGVAAPAGGGAVVLCQSPAGELGWFGLTTGQGVSGRSLAELPNGDIVSTGQYADAATAAPGTPQETPLPIDQGHQGSYVLRYRP